MAKKVTTATMRRWKAIANRCRRLAAATEFNAVARGLIKRAEHYEKAWAEQVRLRIAANLRKFDRIASVDPPPAVHPMPFFLAHYPKRSMPTVGAAGRKKAL